MLDELLDLFERKSHGQRQGGLRGTFHRLTSRDSDREAEQRSRPHDHDRDDDDDDDRHPTRRQKRRELDDIFDFD